jgi:hypothetical protein
MTIDNDRVHWGVVVAVAAVASTPLLTVKMPFRASLVAQAVILLGATLALVVVAAARKGWRHRPPPPRALLIGVALYAGAAAQGTVVALLRGNHVTLVAGQALSMGLLPLAAVGAFGVFPALNWRSFAAGIVGATFVATLVQFTFTRLIPLELSSNDRLALPNALSAAGIAPLALLLAFALAPSVQRARRVLVWVSMGGIAFLIIASRIRSEWLVLPLGIAVYLAVLLRRTRVLSRRVLLAVVAAALLVLAAGAMTVWWWRVPRPNLATGALVSGPPGVRSTALALLPSGFHGAVRVDGTLRCKGTGAVFVRVRSANATAEPSRLARKGVLVAGVAPAGFHLIVRPPADATRLFLDVDDPENLDCTAVDLAVDQIHPVLLANLVDHALQWIHRPPDPGAGSAPGVFAGDASIAFRFREMAAVLKAVRAGSWATWVFGHGLGATFAFDTMGYDNRGHIVHFTHPNFIHNFYVFLPFKLGAVGTLAVLAALALFVWSAVRGARDAAPGTSARRFFAAAAAAWITYIAWSAAAPQILDFQLAPYWGVVVGLTASALCSQHS